MEERVKKGIATILSAGYTDELAKTRSDNQILTKNIPIQLPKAARHSELMRYIRELDNSRYEYHEVGQSLIILDHADKEMYLLASTITLANNITDFKLGKISYITGLIFLTNYYKNKFHQTEFQLEIVSEDDYSHEIIKKANDKTYKLLKNFPNVNLLEYELLVVTRNTAPSFSSKIVVHQYTEMMQEINEVEWGVLIEPGYGDDNVKEHSYEPLDAGESNNKPNKHVRIRRINKENE
ncbi:hypothetical protein [Listeria booriae]|uniref:hypothetical protein n=1 Tax=Listeria booriae TaxID=1552123 RepID=UPI001626F390|nr:hypothetical protein [Listeria booriae]MBC2258892.1 hypothetical protein [Listeria booriae]